MTFKTFFAATALTLAAGTVSAATITPEAASCDPTLPLTVSATCSPDASRNDASAVNLGDADGSFYSLGLGGVAIFGIDPVFTGPLSVIEVTFNGEKSGHKESADVFGRIAGSNVFKFLGEVSNIGSSGNNNVSTLQFAGLYDGLSFNDTSLKNVGTKSTDGFDIDSIQISAVPVPAALGLLLAGIGGLGIAGRRKRA